MMWKLYEYLNKTILLIIEKSLLDFYKNYHLSIRTIQIYYNIIHNVHQY